MDYAKQHVSDICAAMARKNEQAKTTYINLAERMDKPKISKQQQYWQERADSLYMLTKKTMVVVSLGHDNWQVWGKNIADKCGAEYVYETGGSDNVG